MPRLFEEGHRALLLLLLLGPVALAAAAACTPGEVFLPVPGAGKSMILALQRSSEMEVQAIDLEQPFSVSASGRTTLTAILYPLTLTELHLQPGRLFGTGIETQPLSMTPFTVPLHRATVEGGQAKPWQDLGALDEPLASFQIPTFGALACADGGGCAPDAVARSCNLPCATPPAPMPPLEPAAPALPMLLPCPAGWTEVPHAGTATTCAAPEPPARVSCPDGQAQFFGESGCTPIGAGCPADGWPAALPAGAVRYVRASAPAGGDGSKARPYARISDALNGAPVSTVVAVGSGFYQEALDINGPSVVGACARDTRIHNPDPHARATAFFGPQGGSLSGVTLSGASVIVLANPFSPAGAFQLSDLSIITSSTTVGIQNAGRNLSAQNVVVRGPSGLPVWLIFGSASRFDRLVVDGGGGALLSIDASTATITNLVLRGEPPESSGAAGLVLDHGARATVDHAEAEDLGLNSVWVSRSALSISDLSVRDGLADGVHVDRGGRLSIHQSHVERVFFTGIQVTDSTSSLELDQVLIENVRADAMGLGGSGLVVAGGASATATRLAVKHCPAVGLGSYSGVLEFANLATEDCQTGLGVFGGRGHGVRASLADGRGQSMLAAGLGELTIEDLSIIGSVGRSVAIEQDAEVTIRRGRIDGSSSGDGIELQSATATLADIRVTNPHGTGVPLVILNSTASVSRAAVGSGTGPGDAAVLVSNAGLIRISDLSITGAMGPGLIDKLGATVVLERARIRDCGAEGLLVDRANLSAIDLEVAGNGKTHKSPAVHALPRCTVDLSLFSVHDNDDSAVSIEVGASVDLHLGRIGPEPIGVHVLDAAFDLWRLLDQVSFQQVANPIAPN